MSQTFHRDEIRRRLLLRLFGAPITLGPAVLGTVSILSPWLFDLDPAIPVFAGVVGLVAGGASLALRGLLGRDRITREIVEELESEAAHHQEARLDGLRERLAADEDPRDERYLDDLRRLVEAVAADDRWRRHVDPVAAGDILGELDALFERCVDDLDRSLTLAETARGLATPTARDGLLAERDRLLDEVGASVEAVGALVTELQVIGASAGSQAGSKVRALRRNLGTTVAAARAAAAEAATLTTEPPDRRALRARSSRQESSR